MANVRISLISFLLLVVSFATLANATTLTVGGAAGWTTGVDYQAWASRNPVYVGDYLMFYYLVGYHSVLLVSKQDYDTCTTSSPIMSDNSGITYVTPLTAGKLYIICGTPGHCKLGMKFEVNALGYYSSYSPPPPPSYLRPPPPSAYLQSPPPPTYFQSPPPPAYLQSPPPPAYSKSPPPPASYSKSPPSETSPPPPATNSHSPPFGTSPPPPAAELSIYKGENLSTNGNVKAETDSSATSSLLLFQEFTCNRSC